MNEQQPYFYPSYPYYFYPQPPQAYYPAYGFRKENQSGQMPQQNQSGQMPQQNQQNQGQGNIPFGPNNNNNNNDMLPAEESYIENILRMNRGKEATVYMTFEDGSDGGKRQVFEGEIEAAGRDHIILSDPDNDKRYLLLMVYLDYITFDEPINYSYPYSGASGPSAR